MKFSAVILAIVAAVSAHDHASNGTYPKAPVADECVPVTTTVYIDYPAPHKPTGTGAYHPYAPAPHPTGGVHAPSYNATPSSPVEFTGGAVAGKAVGGFVALAALAAALL